MGQSGSKRAIVVGVLCIALGLAAGVGLGLLLSRGIRLPCRSSTAFANLAADSKEECVILVAAAYSRDHDLEQAQARLGRLGAPNTNLWIASLIDGYLAEGRDPGDMSALVELAQGLGVESPAVLAYSATATAAAPSNTPLPETALPSVTPTPAPTDKPLPTDTPTPAPPTMAPTDTPIPPTPTSAPPTVAAPSDTPRPTPTNTPIAPTPTSAPPTVAAPPTAAAPTDTPKPTATPAAKWTWAARLVGPGEDAQTCTDGLKLIRVTVLDAAGNQIPGVWVYEQYTGLYQVSGHKGEDPFWGPGEAEFSQLDGGQMCIAGGEGGACESDLTRNLPCHDPPPLEDLWAAGYCECCEPDITKERCRELFESGSCLGIAHYAWRVEFKRSW
jgi:outer membrane biosynthesis protein TonB